MLQGLKDRLDQVDLDFVGKRRYFGWLSLALVVGSWLLFFTWGPRWGIDFTGGTEIHLDFHDPIEIGDLRDALQDLDIPSDAVQEVGSPEEYEFKVRIQDPEFGSEDLEREVVAALQQGMGQDWVADWDRDVVFSAEVGARFTIRYQGERVLPDDVAPHLASMSGVKVAESVNDQEIVVKLPGLATQMEREIASAMGGRAFDVLAVDAVGPKVGEVLRQQGIAALGATLVLVLVYVAFRFDFAFAPGAVLALVHDVSATMGVFILLDKEFNLPIIGALLTIIGYSLNDTIVIYDRVRENRVRFRREDLGKMINVSINETLVRTLATTFTTMLAILPFFILGSEVIQDFVLAMLLGMFFGCYSTMYVAAPMIIETERIMPWLSSLIAMDSGGEGEDEDDIPDAFLSESEKRRRERARLEKDAVEGE